MQSIGIKERKKSKAEINLITLMKRCDDIIKSNKSTDSLKILGKYVETLESLIEEIRNEPKHNQPDKDQMQNHVSQILSFKNYISSKKVDPKSKSQLLNQLNNEHQTLKTLAIQTVSSPDEVKSTENFNILENKGAIPAAPTISQIKSSNSTTITESNSSELKFRHNATSASNLIISTKDSKNQKNAEEIRMRRELLGIGTSSSSSKKIEKSETSGSLDDLVKYHHAVQEKIADRMLDLTRTLKEQATVAGQVVKKDTEVLQKSSGLMDRNQANLRAETEKLEMYNKRACKCWTWVMLFLVCSIFIAMVLFMRIFKKKKV